MGNLMPHEQDAAAKGETEAEAFKKVVNGAEPYRLHRFEAPLKFGRTVECASIRTLPYWTSISGTEGRLVMQIAIFRQTDKDGNVIFEKQIRSDGTEKVLVDKDNN